MRETDPIEGVDAAEDVHAVEDDFERAGDLVYERMLPALPGSITLMRHELTAALARHGVTAARRSDMELVFTEAANNDAGDGLRQRSGSPGAGLGLLLMRQLADDLRVCFDPDLGGTCVQATFERATYATVRDAAARARDRAAVLREYLRVQGDVTASLHDDAHAVVAQARQAVAHARRRQRERAGA